eukprot:UN26891
MRNTILEKFKTPEKIDFLHYHQPFELESFSKRFAKRSKL